MMQSPSTSVNSEPFKSISEHNCQPAHNLGDRFNYCTMCHVQMSKANSTDNNTNKFLRTTEYSEPDYQFINPNQILENLIKSQSVNRYFNIALKDLISRGCIIDWIKRLCDNFSFSIQCFHLSVAIFDAILSLYKMPEEQLKLLAFIAVYLSAKKLEREDKIPIVKNIVLFFQNEFTKEDFANYETFIVQIFNWNLNLRTPYTFASFFFSKGVLSTDDLEMSDCDMPEQEIARKLQNLILELVEASLKNYEFYAYTPIAIAASAIALARTILGFRTWNCDLEALTWISWDSIKECTEKLRSAYGGNSCQSFHVKSMSDIDEVRTPAKRSMPELQSTDDKNTELAKNLSTKKLKSKKKKLSDKISFKNSSKKGVFANQNILNDLLAESKSNNCAQKTRISRL